MFVQVATTQLLVHAPAWQTGLLPLHAKELPQPPQFALSLWKLTHVPLQSV